MEGDGDFKRRTNERKRAGANATESALNIAFIFGPAKLPRVRLTWAPFPSNMGVESSLESSVNVNLLIENYVFGRAR